MARSSNPEPIEAPDAASSPPIPTREESDKLALLLWNRNPIESFERLRDRVCDALQLVIRIHEQAGAAPPGTRLANVGRELHEPLVVAVCDAQAVWEATSVQRFLVRSEGPVYLDHLNERTNGRVSGSCYHDLALAIVCHALGWIDRELSASGYRAETRFRTAAGNDVAQHLNSLRSNVWSECQRGIEKWQTQRRGVGAQICPDHPEKVSNSFTTPDEILARCEELRSNLRPSNELHRTALFEAPMHIGALWDAMEAIGGILPDAPDLLRHRGSDSESQLRLALLRGEDFDKWFHSVDVTNAINIVAKWCADRGADLRGSEGLGHGDGDALVDHSEKDEGGASSAVESVNGQREPAGDAKRGAERQWLTVSDAARASGCTPAQISGAVRDNRLRSNGKHRRERRIDAADLTIWQLKRAGRWDAVESEATVEKAMKRAQGG
jgi:hypothetical protein